jgi:hypothetical protein
VSHADPAVARLEQLASALDRLAQALVSANPDALAACEAPLEAATSHVPTPTELAAEPAAHVAEQLRRVQLALVRCRSLGRVTTDLITASLSAQGVAPGYHPAGAGVPGPRLGRLEVRV